MNDRIEALIERVRTDDTYLKNIKVGDIAFSDKDKVKILSKATDTIALISPPRKQEEVDELSDEVVEDVGSVEGVTDKEEEASLESKQETKNSKNKKEPSS